MFPFAVNTNGIRVVMQFQQDIVEQVNFVDKAAEGDYTVLLEDGWCFYPIDGGNMQRINLSYFYFLGSVLRRLKEMELNPPTGERGPGDQYYILTVATWNLERFLKDTVDMNFPLSRSDAQSLLESMEKQRKEKLLDYSAWRDFKFKVEEFETVFRREASRVSAFSIEPKGIYDIEKLIDSPESRFPERVRNALPDQALYDFRQAGKCLAYDTPTAAAFHTLRATEVLMIHYYIALTGKAWSLTQRDWGIYIRELTRAGADARITQRLDEIRRFVRNPILHPEANVDADQALPLFELTGGVVVLMMDELLRLTPNVVPVVT